MIEQVRAGVPFIDREFARRPMQPEAEPTESFAETLRSVLQDVNRMQIDSQKATEGMVVGDIQNLHEVMIKAEEAQLSLQFTVQVVNKVIQAYQEVSRMQI